MKTPLYDLHVASGARMAPFAGWDLPIQYAGILAEHCRTRAACSVFDTCHMGELELEGPSACADLDRLLTCDVASLAVGQCRYGYLLDERGGVLDDLTCYRVAPDRYWLVVNAGTHAQDAAWARARLSGTTRFEDLSARTAKLDVQGPASREAVERAFGAPLPDLGYFRFAELELAGRPCVVSRTGYTGEWGYELYFDAEAAAGFWKRLTGPGGAPPAGLGARDTLRLEMGYPLYGHELSAARTPVAAAGGAFISLGKDFTGRAAVERDLQAGPAQRLVGLRLATRRAARPPAAVRSGGRRVGVVTSGSFAPSLGTAVALAYVAAAVARPGTRLSVDAGAAQAEAEVVALPFYREGTARRPASRG